MNRAVLIARVIAVVIIVVFTILMFRLYVSLNKISAAESRKTKITKPKKLRVAPKQRRNPRRAESATEKNP